VNDFSFYWIAAKLLLSGQNPYSATASDALLPAHPGLVLFNPPWALPVIVGLGWLPFAIAQLVWLFVSLALLAISVHWLRQIYGLDLNSISAWLLTATFLPVLVVLMIGQMGPLLLFGIVGFLRFESRCHYLAGALLFFAALKPQLVFLVWIALLLCALSLRRWKPLVGFAGVFALANAAVFLMRPAIFADYWRMLSTAHVGLYESPTLGGLLHHLSGYTALQFVPFGLALGWFAWQWNRFRASWDWRERLPALLLVSVVATSYAWFFDQVILLPALFYAAHRAGFLARIGYMLINLTVLGLLIAHKTVFWYSWTAVAWMLLYELVIVAPPRLTLR
jgi:Glycosyltransferase family 87